MKKDSPEAVRDDFECFRKNLVDGRPLVFLDTAASAQKPKPVLQLMYEAYSYCYANIHRGSYYLSDRLTARFEESRALIAQFINAPSAAEVVFTRSATEAINLVAQSYGDHFVARGSEVVISNLEHHSNIVPWQQLCKRVGATLKVCPAENIELSNQTALVAVTQMSNVLGCVIDVKDIIKRAHEVGAKVLVDACQSIAHLPIDVKELDCDFLVFSSHKLYGPCGVGVLYGKYDILDAMPPYQTGGAMVKEVTYQGASFQDPPLRFEAGTQPIIEVLGLAEAIRYLETLDRTMLLKHAAQLRDLMIEGVNSIGGFRVLEAGQQSCGLISFVHPGIDNADIGLLLDKMGVAIRVGHHCAQPLLTSLGFKSTARASLGIYNTKADIECFIGSLAKAKKMMGVYD